MVEIERSREIEIKREREDLDPEGRVEQLRVDVVDFAFRVQGSGFRVQGSGFRVHGS